MLKYKDTKNNHIVYILSLYDYFLDFVCDMGSTFRILALDTHICAVKGNFEAVFIWLTLLESLS